MKQFGNPPFSKRTPLPLNQPPYFWAIFSWSPPLCPNFKNEIPPSPNIMGGGNYETSYQLCPVSCVVMHKWMYNPANIYMFKFNNRNTRKRCEICSKVTIKIPEWCQCYRSGVFIVNFEHISHLFLVFLLWSLNK